MKLQKFDLFNTNGVLPKILNRVGFNQFKYYFMSTYDTLNGINDALNDASGEGYKDMVIAAGFRPESARSSFDQQDALNIIVQEIVNLTLSPQEAGADHENDVAMGGIAYLIKLWGGTPPPDDKFTSSYTAALESIGDNLLPACALVVFITETNIRDAATVKTQTLFELMNILVIETAKHTNIPTKTLQTYSLKNLVQEGIKWYLADTILITKISGFKWTNGTQNVTAQPPAPKVFTFPNTTNQPTTVNQNYTLGYTTSSSFSVANGFSFSDALEMSDTIPIIDVGVKNTATLTTTKTTTTTSTSEVTTTTSTGICFTVPANGCTQATLTSKSGVVTMDYTATATLNNGNTQTISGTWTGNQTIISLATEPCS